MKSLIRRFFLAAAIVTMIGACTEKDNYPYRIDYLPVQLQGSDKWSILDVKSGDVVVRDRYDLAPSPVVGGMYYVENENGTFDYYDISHPDKPVNNEPFGSVTCFDEEGYAIASHRGGPLQIIGRNGAPVAELPGEVSQCLMFTGGLAPYQSEMGQWGYLNHQGDTVIAARFARVNEFHDGLAVVIDSHQITDSTVEFSVINAKGELQFTASSSDYRLLQPRYVNGVLPAVKGDSMVCLNAKGEEVANPMKAGDAVEKAGYQDFRRTAADKFIVIRGGKMGLADGSNKTLIEPKWDNLVDLSADRYIVMTDSVAQLVDGKGKPVGNARFTHARGSLDARGALRGYIDTGLAVATLMAFFDGTQCCGATPSTTLMDMNGMLGTDASRYVGQNTLVVPQGPFNIAYAMNADIGIIDADSTASFNFPAKVMCVMISLPMAYTGLDTEEQVVKKAEAAMGTCGFVLEKDGLFVSESGPAVSMGYDRGVTHLYYFMNRSYAQPLPRHRRK